MAEFIEMIRQDIEFWKSKEQEWRKMASDSRKHWKKAERELKKLEALKK